MGEIPVALLVVGVSLVTFAGPAGAVGAGETTPKVGVDLTGAAAALAADPRDDHASSLADAGADVSVCGQGDAVVSNTAPTATLAVPRKRVFVEAGTGTTFNVIGTDPDGDLHRVEWYVDDRYVATKRIDGERAWSGFHRALDVGGHTVSAIVYDRDWTNSQRVTWTVVAGDDGENHTSLYVWRRADDVVTKERNRTQFFETTERYGVDAVYLSRGATRDLPDEAIAEFITAAHDRGLAVHALVSSHGVDHVHWSRGAAERVIRYNAGQPPNATYDGIHVNAEPQAGEDPIPTFVDRFDENVTSLADATVAGESVASQDLRLSIAVAPWWMNDARDELATLLGNPALDHVTVMAYSDNAPAIDVKVTKVTALEPVDYEFAVETNDLTADGTDSPATFYEEGPEAMTRAVDAVTRDPPRPDRFRGRTIHSYSGLREWAAENRSTR